MFFLHNLSIIGNIHRGRNRIDQVGQIRSSPHFFELSLFTELLLQGENINWFVLIKEAGDSLIDESMDF
ncbi:hypothetical protein ES703_113959 [subsurface metagenome]